MQTLLLLSPVFFLVARSFSLLRAPFNLLCSSFQPHMLSRPLSSLQLFSLKPPLFLVPSPPCLPLHPGPSLSCPLPDMMAQAESHGRVDRRQIEPLVISKYNTKRTFRDIHLGKHFFLYPGPGEAGACVFC